MLHVACKGSDLFGSHTKLIGTHICAFRRHTLPSQHELRPMDLYAFKHYNHPFLMRSMTHRPPCFQATQATLRTRAVTHRPLCIQASHTSLPHARYHPQTSVLPSITCYPPNTYCHPQPSTNSCITSFLSQRALCPADAFEHTSASKLVIHFLKLWLGASGPESLSG